MQRDLQTKYNLIDTPKLGNLDRKVWTYERFIGEITFRLEDNSHYQRGIDKFVITGKYSLITEVVRYINNSKYCKNRNIKKVA